MKDESLFYSELGNNILSIRTRKGISQDDLAKEIGLSRPSIANIEKGKQRPSIYILLQLSKILGVDIKELLPESIISYNKIDIGNVISLDKTKSDLFSENFISFLDEI
ncbi:helix-turn-helix transcriptional regulator [Faecalibacter bovis]|uniref:Helix-turn-helix transcriptional regulator n=1 Tax=Faecalibacter bovis TaxID=2898187 RepID=A0ABX7XFN4_9FLAO|nr:helix-turn-helix transcriptional regulator [Faecalibacter bovis]QTV06745.1 helix-turn-helix transcriptional regulator [Faecalibacter bovis]